MGREVVIGVVQVSDRASENRNVYPNLSGDAVREVLEYYIRTPFRSVFRLIPDDFGQILNTFGELAGVEGCCLICTTGGTGPAPRDVTVEATEAFCYKMLPGFGERMRAVSLQYVPTAMLSRQTAGICGSTLIVNLPGKPAAIAQCLEAVFPAIPYCLDLIGAPYLEVNTQHIQAFRPKSDAGNPSA